MGGGRREIHEKTVKTEKTCPVCQTKFYGISAQKFCTEKCYTVSTVRRRTEKNKIKIAEKPELICTWCHDKFKSNGNYARFCCPQHNQFYHKMRRRIYMVYPFDHEKEALAFAQLDEKGQQFSLEGC